jgi:hypothetical protein
MVRYRVALAAEHAETAEAGKRVVPHLPAAAGLDDT